jgi:hypothetical protein
MGPGDLGNIRNWGEVLMPEILIEPDDDPRSLLERWGRPTTKVPEDWKAIVSETVKVIS